MKNIVLSSLLFLVACGGGGSSTHDLAGNNAGDMSKASQGDMILAYDLAGVDLARGNGDMSCRPVTTPGDLAACEAPQGASCPTTTGNCLGIGTPCGSCPSGLSCQSGICVQLFTCTPGMGQCGKGATCCKTATTENFPVCLPNQCLPADCVQECT